MCRKKSLSVFPSNPPCHMIGLFFRMLSLKFFKIAIQRSVSTVAPAGTNSMCTGPTESKNNTSIVFLVALAQSAFWGLTDPFLLHSALACLVTGSKTDSQDSSQVMTFSRRSLSARKSLKFSSQSLLQWLLCASDRMQGTNFVLSLLRFKSLCRMQWTVVFGTPVWSLKSCKERRASCHSSF